MDDFVRLISHERVRALGFSEFATSLTRSLTQLDATQLSTLRLLTSDSANDNDDNAVRNRPFPREHVRRWLVRISNWNSSSRSHRDALTKLCAITNCEEWMLHLYRVGRR
jgi:hypothetical protein